MLSTCCVAGISPTTTSSFYRTPPSTIFGDYLQGPPTLNHNVSIFPTTTKYLVLLLISRNVMSFYISPYLSGSPSSPKVDVASWEPWNKRGFYLVIFKWDPLRLSILILGKKDCQNKHHVDAIILSNSRDSFRWSWVLFLHEKNKSYKWILKRSPMKLYSFIIDLISILNSFSIKYMGEKQRES